MDGMSKASSSRAPISTSKRSPKEPFNSPTLRSWIRYGSSKGAKLSFLMENNGGEFVLIAKNEIKDCKALDGKRFAIHGDTDNLVFAAKLWLLNECKVNPNVMIVPGGENRIVALQNNQIDATLVQLADWLNLDSQAPGHYHIIEPEGYSTSAVRVFGPTSSGCARTMG